LINISRNKTDTLFKTLFQGHSLEKGDFVKFKNGKTVYWVEAVSNSFISLYTIPRQNKRIYAKAFQTRSVSHRLRKVSKKLVFYYLSQYNSNELNRFFSDKERMRFFRKWLKPMKRRIYKS